MTETDRSARQELRQATGEVHARLHAVPVFARLAAGRIGLPDYIALLRRLLGFHLGLEAALAAGPSLAGYGIDLAERRRSGLLVSDLQALGAKPLAPVCRLPVPESESVALGCLYVSEGSTLGGQVLAKAVAPLLPPGEAGRRFLLGHGTSHAALWRACCAALEACPDREGLVTGATATFSAFETWFTAET